MTIFFFFFLWFSSRFLLLAPTFFFLFLFSLFLFVKNIWVGGFFSFLFSSSFSCFWAVGGKIVNQGWVADYCSEGCIWTSGVKLVLIWLCF